MLINRHLAIAAINSPENILICGRREAIPVSQAFCQQNEHKTIDLKISHTLHSLWMQLSCQSLSRLASQVPYA